MRGVKRRRTVELFLLFGLGPALLALGPRWVVSVAILAGGIICAVALRADPTIPRTALWGWAAARSGLSRVLARAAVVGLGLLALAVASARPLLPSTQPRRWALVMLLYPISAYAQEVVCRTFFFHRYAALFDRRATRVLASGLIFGWAHVAVNSVAGILLATAAGLAIASTYERTRSTLLVTIEHALYGDLAFTAGLGALFYSKVRWVAGLWP
jgi:membrane protease YdiL (CAAX protease family)